MNGSYLRIYFVICDNDINGSYLRIYFTTYHLKMATDLGPKHVV
jgi:hypothetical protein